MLPPLQGSSYIPWPTQGFTLGYGLKVGLSALSLERPSHARPAHSAAPLRSTHAPKGQKLPAQGKRAKRCDTLGFAACRPIRPNGAKAATEAFQIAGRGGRGAAGDKKTGNWLSGGGKRGRPRGLLGSRGRRVWSAGGSGERGPAEGQGKCGGRGRGITTRRRGVSTRRRGVTTRRRGVTIRRRTTSRRRTVRRSRRSRGR